MTHQMLNRYEIGSGPHKLSCKGMPKIVETQLRYFGQSHGLHLGRGALPPSGLGFL
jgi:hypothetical protein